MTPLTALKKIVAAFKELDCKYCLIGGHAASLYRSSERFTKDVDFALVANTVEQSRNLAEAAIQSIGLQAVVGFIPSGKNEAKCNSVCMITSSPEAQSLTGIVDILLPELPWVTSAVQRAQHNQLDLIFDMVPVITPEDLIISKCYALNNDPDRFQDLDDLKEVFKYVAELDFDYLKAGLVSLKLEIPKLLHKFVPKSLVRKE